MKPGFDDALALADRDFRGVDVLVLCGESGSGKSSAIRFLMHRHAHFRDDPCLRVIEELRSWRDLRHLFVAWWRGQRLLVASHLPVAAHRCLGVLMRTRVIALDRHPQKISRWLDARGIGYSEAAVTCFCAKFGANYSDAELILQHAGAIDFDQALGRFLRQCRLERGGMPSGLPVHVFTACEAEAHYLALNTSGIKSLPD